jgi:hypothetical protein
MLRRLNNESEDGAAGAVVFVTVDDLFKSCSGTKAMKSQQFHISFTIDDLTLECSLHLYSYFHHARQPSLEEKVALADRSRVSPVVAKVSSSLLAFFAAGRSPKRPSVHFVVVRVIKELHPSDRSLRMIRKRKEMSVSWSCSAYYLADWPCRHDD